MAEIFSKELAKQLAKELAPYLIAELRAANESDEWADQRSPKCRATLGRNRWCTAVKRRLDLDENDPHARKVGDRFLLDAVGLSEELARVGKPPVAKTKPPSEEEQALARIAARLPALKRVK